MYLHEFQYPGLEWLPFSERRRIIKAAVAKYDKWLLMSIAIQGSLVFVLPVTVLFSAMFLLRMGLLDGPALHQAVDPWVDFMWYYIALFVVIIQLRMANSGADKLVQRYLDNERQTSVTLRHDAMVSPDIKDSAFDTQPVRRINRKLWFFLYMLVPTVSCPFWVAGFGIPQIDAVETVVQSDIRSELSIKSVKIDMERSEVLHLVPDAFEVLFTRPQSGDFSRLSCDNTKYGNHCRLTLGNEPIETADFILHRGKLKRMTVNFPEKLFDNIEQGLIEKYGKPSSRKTSTLISKVTGAESTYLVESWSDGSGAYLVLSNHSVDRNSYHPLGILTLMERDIETSMAADSAALGFKPDKRDL